MEKESMAKEKEHGEDCSSAPTLALRDLCKENNHQWAPTIGPQTMLSFSLCAEQRV